METLYVILISFLKKLQNDQTTNFSQHYFRQLERGESITIHSLCNRGLHSGQFRVNGRKLHLLKFMEKNSYLLCDNLK